MSAKFSYDEYARSCDPNDFMGQIKRTYKGQPISDEQVSLILTAIKNGLALQSDDVLLDLACGNGSLSHQLFPYCQSYTGIDISGYLIGIAKNNFEKPPEFEFVHDSGLNFTKHAKHSEKYSKMLCYGSVQYFSDEELGEILQNLKTQFTKLNQVFIGNIPDRELANEFYKTHTPTAAELDDTQTAIGRWRTRGQVSAIAEQAGWQVKFTKMPDEFYASTYRFDATLTHAK